MKTTNHTPSPWNPSFGKIIASNGIEVCSMPSRDSANANLIASAPDLLSAVDSCLEIMIRAIGERLPINKGTECEETDWLAAIRKARAAIAKSEGVA